MQQELLSSQTTPEQRRAELTARARSLAARREAERQKLAADLYEQQFRENCDLLRGKESQIATHTIQHVQQQQVCLFPYIAPAHTMQLLCCLGRGASRIIEVV